MEGPISPLLELPEELQGIVLSYVASHRPSLLCLALASKHLASLFANPRIFQSEDISKISIALRSYTKWEFIDECAYWGYEGLVEWALKGGTGREVDADVLKAAAKGFLLLPPPFPRFSFSLKSTYPTPNPTSSPSSNEKGSETRSLPLPPPSPSYSPSYLQRASLFKKLLRIYYSNPRNRDKTLIDRILPWIARSGNLTLIEEVLALSAPRVPLSFLSPLLLSFSFLLICIICSIM